MNSSFQLYIKNNTLVEKPVEQTNEEMTETEKADPDDSSNR